MADTARIAAAESDGQPDVEFIAQGLASDLAVELNRYTGVSVFLSRGAGRERGGAPLPRFELNGKLALAAGDLRITFHLIETQSGQQTWANTYACAAGPARAAALDRIVQTTAATVAEEHGILASQLGNHPLPRSDCGSNAYEAILRHHHFELTKEPQRFAEALAALREAIQLDASCAPCWSYLARLGAVHWALDLPGDGIPIDESVAAARRGVQLAPVDVCSRAVLTYVLLLSDATDAARAEANAALQLNGMSAYWLDAIGYLLTLSGDWKQGPELIRRAVQINPFPRKACYAALWMDALRRDDPAQALSAACRHAPEFHFWGPLMEAVALVIDDNAKAAAEPARRLLEMKPDFPQRGDWLIRRYVKFDDLVRRIEQALGIAGLALDPASPTPTPAASAN